MPTTDRDPRGFALKFYTEKGNYDLVGNNTPVFFVRDPSKFQDFHPLAEAHARHGSAQQQHAVGLLVARARVAPPGRHLDERPCTPRTWATCTATAPYLHVDQRRGQAGLGEVPLQDGAGHPELHAADAKAMRAEDPDYHRRDLHQAIEKKSYPAWQLEMQIMPFADAATYRFDPFDLHEGLAAPGLSADHGRPARPRPQPREFLRRDRAGGILAGEHGAGDRAQP